MSRSSFSLLVLAGALGLGVESFADELIAPPPSEFATDEFTPAASPITGESLSADEIFTADPAAAPADAAVPPVSADIPAPVPPKPKPPAPKKKTPPVFPGPKTLPPTGPYKVLFFENDFSYKKDPNHEHVFGEEAKLMPFELFDVDMVLSTGGELRHRFIDQSNRLQPGGPDHTDYNQWRWRHYIDLKAGDRLRFYVEGLHADTFGEDLPEQPIDVNRWDIQNAFVDYLLFKTDTGTHTLRYGRQELLFGRQRLVSPLDWANVRRNFEGFRYLVKEQDWKMDLFCVNPVNSATGYQSIALQDDRFDHANHNVFFSGAYFTYTAIENANLDLYYLWLQDKIPSATRADGERHTVGSRYSWLVPVEQQRVWDFDVEAAYQFGNDNAQSVQAGFATMIAGHTWKAAPWSPRLSGLFYYGSGDVQPGDGTTNTFSVLFPLNHAYWALSDNLSGQNLYDYCLQVDVKPTKKTAITVAHHFFELASNGDRAYNVAGNAVGTPGNGTSMGNALDLYGYYAFNPNFDIQAGYSWFWFGNFIDRTTPRGDCRQFYVQTSIRY
ncbi:alginate export family protein [Planctomyces sp. SH-PL14]|uniref:alginate export family protein n=1 Tax=Planctomyces sp. SH-PL14 TaxID=1632864 RepID=UPI00078D6297|nr:alginate export family protein [Planctomyces sp. SH-PL14]AMV17643.1 hypothetical protein VT03_07100 [Planctomyces sp. SH-PL14]